jgi:hypothetical protein
MIVRRLVRVPPTVVIVRHLVRVPPTVLALAAGLLAGACSDDGDAEPPADIEPDVVFALDRAAHAEAVVPLLIARQRALFEAIRSNDSERLSGYLVPSFHWNPGYVGTAGMPTPGGSDYLAMLAGHQPASLAELPTLYDVQLLLTDELAWVYAQRGDGAGGIIAAWERRDDVWRAQWARDVTADLAAWQENRRRNEALRRERR